jgi:hypothetical protein
MNLQKLTLQELEAEHKTLYEKFIPTLGQYQKLAAEALQLQQEIYRRKLQQLFPKAKRIKALPVATISAREQPAKVDQLLQQVEKQTGVTITHIVENPNDFTYRLFGFENEDKS